MRHGRAGYRLGRKTAHRTAMLRNIAAGLFEHGQIVTTIPKAKAVQPFVEKIITDAKARLRATNPEDAKRLDVAARRRVAAKLGGNRLGFDWLYLPKNASEGEKEHVQKLRDQASQFFDLPESSQVERNRYGELRRAPKLVKHVFERIATRYETRNGGYTRIVKLGRHRIGDGTELCVLQFVGSEDGAEISGNPSTRRRQADRRTAYYKKLRDAKKAAAGTGSPGANA
ncbi:MAG: 50S ribosomal protein L17 [Planctomycetota bacterium]|nr:50S ribosomal protein L17 [Planctomycetota bacterium]